MTEIFDIAGYVRISVDDELDRDNISIENQKAIIQDFVKNRFPGSSLTFYEDRDRSGYTFEQREGYQAMRKGLMSHKYDILIVKDFSRFSRRNSRGLVELEDLRDAGVRMISIGDGIDFPNDDDWLKIQFQFLINEMPVTDTSKKVRNVIKRRQADGEWLCAAPYGYIINKRREFEIVPTEADIVRKIFDLYNNDGWGYKRIANYLTDQGMPTPRMSEQMRKEADGQEYKRQVKAAWAIVTVQGILDNVFYIGTLRQGKYTRAKINGKDVKRDDGEHIVIENHHQAIIDYRTFATTIALREKRSRSNYRGVKINDNVYSGFLECGDCGSPMFAMSRRDLKPAYTCGTYHRRGRSGCTSHHIRVDKLDELLKDYVQKVMEISADMIEQLNCDLARENDDITETEQSADHLAEVLDELMEEMKVTKRQRIREIMKKPEKGAEIEATYDELEEELQKKIDGLNHQIDLLSDKRNTVIKVNRAAKTVLDVFADILAKEKLDRNDLELIIDRVLVFEDHLEIKLQRDIDALLRCGTLEEATNFNFGIENSLNTRIIQCSKNKLDKVFDVHVISDGEPLRVCIDVEYLKYFNDGSSDETLRRFLDHVEDLGGPENVVIDAVPSKGVERESALQRLRTEIMSGKGPDVFIVACPGGVFNNPSEALFTVPEKAMQNGLFLTLDDYIENAQYMDWNKLTSSVMNAGKNEYGQQILPLSYSVPVTCFVAAECESTDYSEACWQDMTDGSDDMLVASATWFHSESAASEIMNGDYTEFTFGSLADYENEVLSFTENELYERTIEILELEEEYSNGEYADAPRHYQTLLYPGFNLRADNYGDGIDPFVGIKSDESLKMVPIYCDEGGCVAEVQYFAAINSSTRYADEAFFILDVLFSLDSQQNSDMYEIFCEYGLPTHESLMQEATPTKYSMRFALTDENYAEFNSLREQINCARFRNALTVEMHNTFTECREKYAVGDLAAVQQKIDDSYRTMEQILNE